MLRLAREFGRSPEEVENWDPYWRNRAEEWIDGEAIAAKLDREAAAKRGK